MKKLILLGLLMLFFFPAGGALFAADEAKTILIAGFINKGAEKDRSINQVMTRSFISFMDKLPNSVIVPFEETEKASKDFWKKSSLDTEMALSIAQQLNADRVITGDYSINDKNEKMTVNVYVYDVVTKSLKFKSQKTGPSGVDVFDTIDDVIKDVTGLIVGRKVVLGKLNFRLNGAKKNYIAYINGKKQKELNGLTNELKTDLFADEPQDFSLRDKSNGLEVYRQLLTFKASEEKKLEYSPTGVLLLNVVHLDESAFVYIDGSKVQAIENGKTAVLSNVPADTPHKLDIISADNKPYLSRNINIQEGKNVAMDLDAREGVRIIYFPVQLMGDGIGAKAGIDIYPLQSIKVGVGASVLSVNNALIYGLSLETAYYFIKNDGTGLGLGLAVEPSVYFISGTQISTAGKLYLEYGRIYLSGGVRYSISRGDFHPVLGIGYRF